ncbi:MAG: bifunctional diaminohydroxyphosphoribosylaminopyrimidine deaminase/5-amino-6-(5-phosphoribosylamino)uracil reductase RibD [Lentilitoribacter sp.]
MTTSGEHIPAFDFQNEEVRLNQEIIDKKFMCAAIRLARKHEGLTAENPSVSALVVKYFDGLPVVMGAGVTAIGGRPHAEVLALNEAGSAAKGAHIYVTLEPCSHYGKTPPCAEAIIKAGVTRVVVAANDPDDRVSGRGFEKLRVAGIEVVENLLSQEAEYGLAGYLMRKRHARPFVTLKMAMSKDGLIGVCNGRQIKITSEISNGQVQVLRALNDAILVGSGTVQNDNPTLTCRLNGLKHRSPIRVVMDRKFGISTASNLVQTAKQYKLIVATSSEKSNSQAYKELGVETLPIKSSENDNQLAELFNHLGQCDVSTLLVEGGSKIASSFLNAGYVDRIVIFQSDEKLDVAAGVPTVKAPITPENMPQGFLLKNKLTFGSDVMYEYEKIS